MRACVYSYVRGFVLIVFLKGIKLHNSQHCLLETFAAVTGFQLQLISEPKQAWRTGEPGLGDLSRGASRSLLALDPGQKVCVAMLF